MTVQPTASEHAATDLDIAVIGMSGAFPGAANVAEFWRNLRDGVSSVRFFTDEELLARGVPASDLADPDYVKAASTLDDIAGFDADFFGINPNEARATDPQHRLFLECAWAALEDAGYDPGRYDGDIGVFAGLGMNSYVLEVLGRSASFWRSTSVEQMLIGNDKDFLPSRVSYKLNLTGPSINVNTACSTSLVAVHLARQSLLLGESDMALVGGVSIVVPNGRGYRYVKDGIQSPDGHCRAFDAQAQGTVWGDGCGVVVLKRLSAAIADGDQVYAVVKGTAVNNDGSLKVGYTAPSVEGQSRVIVEALAEAGVSPDEIGYVEAHGTGTALGDPIEISAISNAFRTGTDRVGYCPIGSVKTNIGHLNAAAGIAGFIKTVLALRHREVPPSLNFTEPNPEIDFATSPFYVQTELTPWPEGPAPRRAGVSAMGIGGTNCHVVLEEAPASAAPSSAAPGGEQVLLLSARTEAALERATEALARHLAAHPEVSLADVAHTLQCGRKHFRVRRALLARSVGSAARTLAEGDPEALLGPGDTGGPVGLAAWLAGEEVDWQSRWPAGSARRVSLPGYQFEHRSYWYEPEIVPEAAELNGESYFTKLPDMGDWFSLPVFRQRPLPFSVPPAERRTWLVFADDRGVGTGVADALAAEDRVVTVTAGTRYERRDDGSFVLDPDDEEGYTALLTELRTRDRLPDAVLYCWPLRRRTEQPHRLDRDALLAEQEDILFPVLRFAQALDALSVEQPLTFTAVTEDVFDVTGTEELDVHAATLGGACLVLQQTYGHIACRVVDLSGAAGTDRRVAQLLAEVRHDTGDLFSAYRAGKRYVRGYEPVRVEADAPRPTGLREGGTYLVFGGLEGIGSLIAEYIVRERGGKLLLLEESDFPAEEDWDAWLAEHPEDDPIAARVRKARELTGLGAHWLGNIAGDPEENDRLLADVEERFGRVNGLVHAPGSSNAKRVNTIRAATVEDWRRHFDAVGASLVLLDRMFAGRELDFRIMTNSLGSVLGGDGFFHIATVGNYAKAYATMRARETEQAWTVQCWDSWTIEWVGISQYLPVALFDRVKPSVLTTEEGLRCFELAFAVTGAVEVDISATDFAARYRKWIGSTGGTAQGAHEIQGAHPRPELETGYVAPEGETQQALAALFSRILGLERVGTEDSFFELGGHSLLGVELAAEVRKEHGVELDLYYLYGMSTVAQLAEYIEGAR
ncbi:beta-ketoacyl synthase N-terminal-like domain-containing protein [Kitasatospora xanthocidica]|uniref:type I polyketide synthase n=1 Tax=Kitasatospora xanthocidica TaxID=83382 RepID=UPI0036E85422